MRVAIAGAGAVGRSVAAELLENGHEVLLIDKDPRAIKADSVPDAEWLLADACELSSLDEAALQRCDVVIASSGDDKANLVISLLAKQEFALLQTLASEPTRVFTKHELLRDVWGFRCAARTRTIDSHACRLRCKLRGADDGHWIENIWGIGYRLVAVDPDAHDGSAA